MQTYTGLPGKTGEPDDHDGSIVWLKAAVSGFVRNFRSEIPSRNRRSIQKDLDFVNDFAAKIFSDIHDAAIATYWGDSIKSGLTDFRN